MKEGVVELPQSQEEEIGVGVGAEEGLVKFLSGQVVSETDEQQGLAENDRSADLSSKEVPLQDVPPSKKVGRERASGAESSIALRTATHHIRAVVGCLTSDRGEARVVADCLLGVVEYAAMRNMA
ncbi:hypothetical protein CsSME_00034295 [Camellia sinensis var. sinensis]